MNTGDRIRYLRIKNNLTSKELSKALEISESAVSLYENGKRKPSIELLIKISNYFSVSTDFLLGVDNSTCSIESGTDFSKVLQNAISLLNNQNYLIFEGKDIDDKTLLVIKNNLNCLLENTRMMTGN